jgi:hypothetical protein
MERGAHPNHLYGASGRIESFYRHYKFGRLMIAVPAGTSIIWEKVMSWIKRILLCMGILAADLALFFLPLPALFLIYIILFNPPWFRGYLNNLAKPHKKA